MANFSRYVNIDKDTTPFQSVIFGKDSTLLEVELNEVQVLLSNMIRRLSNIVGYYSQSGITFLYNTSDDSVDFKMSGIHILNGYVFNIPDGFCINVPYNYRLYLKVEEVDVNKDSELYNNGIVQSGNEIDNTIVDDRHNAETSMRKSLCVTPTITKSTSLGDEYFYVGFSDKDNSVVNTNYFSDTILSQIQCIKDDINAKQDKFITVVGTLNAGSTSITLSNPSITTDSTLDFYTSVYGVNPKTVSVSAGSVTITFKAQSSNMQVKVVIS